MNRPYLYYVLLVIFFIFLQAIPLTAAQNVENVQLLLEISKEVSSWQPHLLMVLFLNSIVPVVFYVNSVCVMLHHICVEFHCVLL